MALYRLTRAAQADITAILVWSADEFGPVARARYEALIAAAIRDAAAPDNSGGRQDRPELGAGVFSWHLTQSRSHVAGSSVRRPRHFLICRWDGDVLVVGRVLHDAMELRRHLPPPQRLE